MNLFEKSEQREHCCEHENTVVEDGMLFCVSCGEEIPKIISTEKSFNYYSQKTKTIYRQRYHKTERFTKFLDGCDALASLAVDNNDVCTKIIHDFYQAGNETLRGKSKLIINLNILLYHICKKNGVDIDISKFKFPKSKKAREKNKEKCQDIFKKLGWNYFIIL